MAGRLYGGHAFCVAIGGTFPTGKPVPLRLPDASAMKGALRLPPKNGECAELGPVENVAD